MIDRRDLIKLSIAAAASWPCRAVALSGQETVRLWPGNPPGGGGPSGPLRVNGKGAVTNVSVPTLEVVRPARPNGSAVLIAAGGGYRLIENAIEARPAADWLVARGITAFILTYRLPGEGWTAGPAAPLQDAQRALRLIRSDASVAGDRVAVLGFSAGGHLMGLTAAWFDHPTYDRIDEADARPIRPDAAALIYPVITLEPPYDDTKTRRVLVGDDPSPAQSAEWSVQTHVRPGMPPTFLAQAEDDQIASPENEIIMAAACRAAGTPVDLQRYASGRHGFAMGRPGTASMAWPEAYAAWLKGRGLMT